MEIRHTDDAMADDVSRAINTRLTEIKREMDALAPLVEERAVLLDALLALTEGRPLGGRGGCPRDSEVFARRPPAYGALTDRILQVVRERPGVSTVELMDTLEHAGLSRRRDQRRAITAQTSELVAKGELRRDLRGRLFSASTPPDAKQ